MKLLELFFQFVVLVWRMRKHQIAWFRDHRQSDLIWAKKYESDVDRELVKLLSFKNGEPVQLDFPEEQRPTVAPEQENLFAENDNENTKAS